MHHEYRITAALFCAVILSVLTGCSSVPSTTKRAGLAALGTAAGGAAGYVSSDKDPRATMIGAVAGAALTHLALGEDRDLRQAGFDEGYIQGQSDSIKRQYFLRHAKEAQPPPNSTKEGESVYYVVPGPEITVDGRKLAPHRVAVRVVE